MEKIRLDKMVADMLVVGRKEAAAYLKKGNVQVNGRTVTDGAYKADPQSDVIIFEGKPVTYSPYLYLMLNKPSGYVCSSGGKDGESVLSLFPAAYRDKGIACVGRLDKDTVGLLLVTNDGQTAHRLLAPKTHAEKRYYVRCDKPFLPEDAEILRRGIVIEGKNTAPARLERIENDPFAAFVTLTEGKFHEVKRLCYACGEKEVLTLRRDAFAGLTLDPTLAEGDWRPLTDDERRAVLEKN